MKVFLSIQVGFWPQNFLFLENDEESLTNVVNLLKIFEVLSELKINWSKSGLASIHVSNDECGILAPLVGYQILQWPLIYLGIPLGGTQRLSPFGMM